MYVAILAALLMEFESFKYASEWLQMTAPKMVWHQAFDSFAEEEWDRWPFLRNILAANRKSWIEC